MMICVSLSPAKSASEYAFNSLVYCCCLPASTSIQYFVYLMHIWSLYIILSYVLPLLYPWLSIIHVLHWINLVVNVFTKYSSIPIPLLYNFCSSSVIIIAFGIFLSTWNPGVLSSVICCVLTMLQTFAINFCIGVVVQSIRMNNLLIRKFHIKDILSLQD